MPNYRVAITVVLDPVEGGNADDASHIALEAVRKALCSDNTDLHDELPDISDDTLECWIRGAVPSENTEA
jgi:hypothetical protein